MVVIKKFDTGDSVQDMNLAEHYEKEHDGGTGNIQRFSDCVIYVEESKL